MNNLQEDGVTKALVGSWIQAIGTVLSAIAGTPFQKGNQAMSPQFTDAFFEQLDLLGNVLQATGNALVADSEDGYSLDKAGNTIQSIGNMVNVTGFLIDMSEQMKIELNIKGNLIQAVGGSVSFADAIDSEDSFYDLYGNLLQIIGNSMQALSDMKELNGTDGKMMNAAGGWIQAIGSILTLIGAIKTA